MSGSEVVLHTYKWPRSVIGRFVAKGTMKIALLWAGIFSLTITSSALVYTQAYKSVVSRMTLATTFGNNVGLKVLLGNPRHLETVAGFTVWRAHGIITIIGSIWGLLISTKTFRGDENSGRWELFLSGQTTARGATTRVLLGFGAVLAAMFVTISGIVILIGQDSQVNFSIAGSFYFALATIMSTAIFISVGSFMSQLMPTRSRAAQASAAIFALSFALRGVADASSNLHWLIYISPLGWVEKLQPLIGSEPVWFIPIVSLILVLSTAAIWLSGRRDLGESIIQDNDSAPARTRLLNSPLAAAFRLTRATTFTWLLAFFVVSVAFGSLAKTAGDVFKASAGVQQVIGRLDHQAQLSGAVSFLGIIFFFIMTLMMVFIAVSMSHIREDEAEGYLDNLLIRAVSRLRWLSGRLGLILSSLIVAGGLVTLGSWIASGIEHIGIPFHTLALAGLNAISPAFLLLGLGVFVFGYLPRKTSPFMYAVIAWSFLVEMIGSVGNLNHWFLDTSLFHHVAFSPAVDPNWRVVSTFVIIGCIAALAGIHRFIIRDLANE